MGIVLSDVAVQATKKNYEPELDEGSKVTYDRLEQRQSI